MEIVTNIGFIISLCVATATIPFNIIWNISNTKPIYLLFLIILVGISAILWIFSIRSLAKYKRFVYFGEDIEEEPLLVNGVDIDTVKEIMDGDDRNA